MKNVLSKLRVYGFILKLRFLICWDYVTKPIKICVFLIKRYLQYQKIDRESEDSWEAYVKKREINNQDEFKVRKAKFLSIKTEFLGSLFKASMFASFYALAQEKPEELSGEFITQMDKYKQNFDQEKNKLVELLKKLSEYEEIKFDSEISKEIIDWSFEGFKKKEMVTAFEEKIDNYLQGVDLKES